MDEVATLLAQYVRNGSETAFAELVRRHVGLVYSSARRQLGDLHDAEDVTQTVFLALAQNASKIRNGTVLASWLLSATRYVCATGKKMEARRKFHERQSGELPASAKQEVESTAWQEVASVLDEAVAELPESQRGALVLRYFQGMSMQEVAASLGISELAARQRVSRAVIELRQMFTRRGINVTAEVLPVLIGAHAIQAVPPALGISISSAVHVIGSAGAHTAATGMTSALSAKVVWIVAAGLTLATITATIEIAARRPASTSASVGSTTPLLAKASTGPAGWPVELPGQVTGTPAVADLEGNGRLAVIVPCLYQGGALANPHPIQQRLVYALRPDGTVVPGWPVNISAIPGANPVSRSLGWASNPSVMDVDGDGRDEVFILDRDGVDLIKQTPGGVTARKIAPWGDGLGSVPLVDLDGDGQNDIVLGRVLTHVDGSPLPTWPRRRTLYGGFAPCIGDARGDGQLLLYHPFYDDSATVAGYDRFGHLLPGWPHKVMVQCSAPVMGDITGDGTMSVVAVDGGLHLFAWSWDGRPLSATHSQGRLQGIFKEPIEASPPALADLDGEGRAQIIVFDHLTQSLKAWRANGSGVTSPDGTIVRLPGARRCGGVSVVGPDEQGAMNLFVATYWVRLERNKHVTVTNMLPEDADMMTQPTVADLDANRTLDVIFGLSDGRVFVYRTGQHYLPRELQWLTANGNFRRTGAWLPPTTRPTPTRGTGKAG
ncbi:MAG TPA: sigma-70 family RNA polymerase sigma factor [Tepidisphaeraceae bacterium]|jgi:RNA polymerase sigma factor (sigma-70 family)|nr:sigma-70 family RNA polymerase sigma factor [Tepidisphaeraceae bacterium]